jgi:hypothetical protein
MSQINAIIINENFPVPGVDNDTVGFRDNFATIKNNFIASKREIEILDSSTAKIDEPVVSFGGNKITNAVLQNNVTAVFNGGTVPSSDQAAASPNAPTITELSFANGEYQYFNIAGLYSTPPQTPRAVIFNITEIPSTGFAKMIVELKSFETYGPSQDGHIVTFTAAGGLIIKKNSTWPLTAIQLRSTSDPVIFEITTRPSSGNVLIEYKGVFA